MKFRHLFYLLASLSMVLSACESDDETSGNNEPPEVALPSAEFRPNSLTSANRLAVKVSGFSALDEHGKICFPCHRLAVDTLDTGIGKSDFPVFPASPNLFILPFFFFGTKL